MIVIIGHDPRFVHTLVTLIREIQCAADGIVLTAAHSVEQIAEKVWGLNPKVILVSDGESYRVLCSYRRGVRASRVNLAPILRHHFETIRAQ